ncbi:MAG TPA: hypothetical protein VFX28_12225, partial [Methylomirabilota bacterium]|nr:hypothetical protein [Methylomirabilota bacterium]
MRIRRSAGLAGRLALLVALLALSSPAPPARAQQGRADVSKAAAAVAESQGDRDRERKYLEAYDQISTQATVRCVAILVFGLVL